MHIPIHRSANNAVIAGVIGGISAQYGWNATIARVIYVLLSMTVIFPGILVYLILWMLMESPIETD
ncbi:PspC domain-containing protein [Levilactobacillus bambusae]|uniref:PspC domain-containing protein n=1 Tax=Levilactobacillus bambusae TaxID=2024736 RepID=A0A2V1MZQ9_9LACO|nr:PspC domain-containing protein [Levilactobacillus bambusae]PWG00253.1 PspC domain-containing protein [Levilactobacillus bambusae]